MTAKYQNIDLQLDGEIAVIRLARPDKRNALNAPLVLALRDLFQELPDTARAAVITGEGDHFSAGLDLSEIKEYEASNGVKHSRMWHTALNQVQFGPVPVIAALHGAVIGGGLELAAACHVRVAEQSTFYALPEGTRGIFVGGGGSVRIPRLIGVARMADMMMTGRVYTAQEGERVGFAQYLVPDGQGFAKAMELARIAASNAPMTNYAIMHALPRIAEQPADHGYFTEALMVTVTSDAPEAKARVRAFLEGNAAKVTKG